MSARAASERILDVIPAGLAVAILGAVARTWWQRDGYAYDLEWMEGGMLAHAWRILHGLPLYPDAGPDWLPYVYPPGYPALVAALGSVFGLGYPIARLVSVAGTLGAAAAAAFAVARSGAGWAVGVASAGVFLGCYQLSGGFYDLVRPDGIAMALLGWSIAVGLERWRRAPEIAGLLLALAFTAKHHTAAYGVAMALGLWARDGWRSAARFTAASAGPAGLFTLAMELATSGRFLEWILAVPASHPVVGERVFPGSMVETGSLLLPACCVAAALLVFRTRRLGWALAAGGALLAIAGVATLPPAVGIVDAPLWVGMACGACVGAGAGAAVGRIPGRSLPWEWVYGAGTAVCAWATASIMRGHNGGFLNVWIPLHWALALAFGVAIGRFRALRPGLATSIVGSLCLMGQLGWEAWKLDLARLVPNPEDVDAGAAVVAALREQCDGPILSPLAPWLAVQAGQEPSWHLISLWDVDHRGGPFFDRVPSIAAAVRSAHWACIVDGDNSRIGLEIPKSYRLGDSPRLPPRALMPKTGWRVRPSRIWIPKEAP